MTPGARVAAAISVLEEYLQGVPSEKCLTNWARRSRFAGSKDRAAVRDIVFDAIRRRRSCGGFSNPPNVRLWVARVLQNLGDDPSELYSGEGHSPDPLTDNEKLALSAVDANIPDLPDWAVEKINQTFDGSTGISIANLKRDRAPATVRVNLRKSTVEKAQSDLSDVGIETRTTAASETALIMTGNARRLSQTDALQTGIVELQDAHSQALASIVPVQPGDHVLDYCAGGGGKTLALAARHKAKWFAHDLAPKRLQDLKVRALRAGVKVTVLTTEAVGKEARFEHVFCDVPCSGSGAWRRSPDARWATTPENVATYVALQQDICEQAVPLVKSGGTFTFMTCSIFSDENDLQVDWVKQTFPQLMLRDMVQYLPSTEGDGFFGAVFDVT